MVPQLTIPMVKLAEQIALEAIGGKSVDDFTSSMEKTKDTWIFTFVPKGGSERPGFQVVISKRRLRVLDYCRLRPSNADEPETSRHERSSCGID